MWPDKNAFYRIFMTDKPPTNKGVTENPAWATADPCEFCSALTLDIVIKANSGEKTICGNCLWLALEKAHDLIKQQTVLKEPPWQA